MTRLPDGGRIDRGRTLNFRFDGQAFAGHPGDTLASALLAAGVRRFGRSFKLHRPRGVWGSGNEEPNALVELREGAHREPNTRATTIELHEGLAARSQNRWPSLGFDLLAVNSLLAPLFGAGFYYKTFMWPAAFWEKLYEPLIRRAAGLGRAADAPDPDRYERAHAFCDVLAIGAGPAGLAAALAAGRTGARVLLLDEDSEPGGRLLADRHLLNDAPAMDWATTTLAELRSLPNVTILPRTTLFGVFDHGVFGAVERVADHLAPSDGLSSDHLAPSDGLSSDHLAPSDGLPSDQRPGPGALPRQRYWKIVARRSVLAAGALERPIAFAGNDAPGVMSAAAVRAYIHRWAVRPGRRAVLFTAGDDGWRTAEALHATGAEVAAIVDARRDPSPALVARARALGTQLIAGGSIRATTGGLRHVTAADAEGREHRFAADLLAVAGGWNPLLHLTCHLGGRPQWDAERSAFLPGMLPPGMAIAGAAAGRFGLAACLATGAAAGWAAAETAGFPGQPLALPRAEDEPTAVAPFFWVRGGKQKAFVDFQHDVTAADIALAAQEGFSAIEHTKRYTTLGMATDQGKTANVVGLAILAELTGRSIETTGTTSFRPPYTPVALGALAGAHTGRAFRPTRLAPTHDWSAANGASFAESGPWLRAQWYARPGEAGWRDSVDREVLAVRRAVGFCDVSTLGKIEVTGPGAAIFLDLVYTNTMSALVPGRARYGLMLREDGFLFDDGTCARLAPDRFVLTTTTAQAARVLQHLEFAHQVLRPDLDLACLSVTDAWAQVAIAGPGARDVVAALADPPFDCGNAAFAFMAAAELTVCGGTPARLFRISFSGELAYELAVPADHGAALMARLAEHATPNGTEALSVLRVEKGHPAGAELNGRTTPGDLGLAALLAKRKDFIGRRLLERPALQDPARPVLVGLKPVDPAAPLKAGAHFLDIGAAERIENDLGHLTSAAFSPTLGHMIGLGLVANGRRRFGQRVRAFDPVRAGDTLVEIGPPCFVDPTGDRLRG